MRLGFYYYKEVILKMFILGAGLQFSECHNDRASEVCKIQL